MTVAEDTLARLVANVRRVMHDEGTTFYETIPCDGSQVRFELPLEFVDDTSTHPFVLRQESPTKALVLNTDYFMDFRDGVVTMVDPPPAGAVLVATGMYYREFLPSDIEYYVLTAFMEHAEGTSPTVVLGEPGPGQRQVPLVEESLITYQAAIKAIYSLLVDAAQDYDIITPDGVQIPRTQRYNQLMSLLGYLREDYGNLASALNVGPYRIEQYTLRRVSTYTGRYVPIYASKEFDDRSFPTRVLPPIDVPARQVPYRGEWLVDTPYAVDDLIDRRGQRYIANIASTGVDPLTDDGTHWSTSTINTGWTTGI